MSPARWLQVQKDFPLLKVLSDRVLFQFTGFFRRVSVPRDVGSLREAAERLSHLATAHDDLMQKVLPLNRSQSGGSQSNSRRKDIWGCLKMRCPFFPLK